MQVDQHQDAAAPSASGKAERRRSPDRRGNTAVRMTRLRAGCWRNARGRAAVQAARPRASHRCRAPSESSAARDARYFTVSTSLYLLFTPTNLSLVRTIARNWNLPLTAILNRREYRAPVTLAMCVA